MMLFVYGTLIDDETRKNILKRSVSGTPATLDGYNLEEIIIENESYPAAEKRSGCLIKGLLIEITSEELKELDVYETDAYKRREVELTNRERAWVYINKNSEFSTFYPKFFEFLLKLNIELLLIREELLV